MRYILLVILFIFTPFIAAAVEYDVGGGGNDYATISECLAGADLGPDDIINVYPGTYAETWNTVAEDSGGTGHPVTLRGVDASGNPILTPSNTVTVDLSGLTTINVWSDYMTIQGIRFYGCPTTALDSRAAETIFQYLKVENSVGSITVDAESSGTIYVQYCEFSNTGSTSHQLYSGHADHLIIQFCYFHGHDNATFNIIKFRDILVTIQYNYIEMGLAAYAIDGATNSAGEGASGDGIVIGNVIVSSVNGLGRNGVVKWGQEPRAGDLYFINNTLIRTSDIDPDVFAVDLSVGSTYEISNNIFYNFSDLTRVDNAQDLIGTNNWVHTGTTDDGLASSVNGTDPGFVSMEYGGYKLSAASACVNTGDSAASYSPTYQFDSLTFFVARADDGQIDIGAFEYYQLVHTGGGSFSGMGNHR